MQVIQPGLIGLEATEGLKMLVTSPLVTPGVGPVLSRTLLADLAKLETLSRQQIAALLGVAPLNQDSRTLSGKRTVCGGRAVVRRVLYMSTLIAVHDNPVLTTFYQRLCPMEKVPAVALGVYMFKLLATLQATLKRCTPSRTNNTLSA